jgi:hypothetical protein
MAKVTNAQDAKTGDRREAMATSKMAASVDGTLSSSLPELNAPDKRSRSLLNPVTDEMISFITAKENLRRLMNYDGHIYRYDIDVMIRVG